MSKQFFSQRKRALSGNVIPFPRPRRAVLKPVTNDDGHVTGFDLGWITISREMAIRIGRMAEVGAQ